MGWILGIVLGVLPLLPPEYLEGLTQPFLKPADDVFALWEDPLYWVWESEHGERGVVPIRGIWDPLVFEEGLKPRPYLSGIGDTAVTFLFSERGSPELSDVGLIFGNRYGRRVPLGFLLRKVDRGEGSAHTLAFLTGYEEEQHGFTAFGYRRSWNNPWAQDLVFLRLEGRWGMPFSGAFVYLEASGLDQGQSWWGELQYPGMKLAVGRIGSDPFTRLDTHIGPFSLWGGKIGPMWFGGGRGQGTFHGVTLELAWFRGFPHPDGWKLISINIGRIRLYKGDSTFSLRVEGGLASNLLIPELDWEGDTIRRKFMLYPEPIKFWLIGFQKLFNISGGIKGRVEVGCGEGLVKNAVLPGSGCRSSLRFWRSFRWREVVWSPILILRKMRGIPSFWEARFKAVFYRAVVIEVGGYNLTDVRVLSPLVGRHYRVRVGVRLFD